MRMALADVAKRLKKYEAMVAAVVNAPIVHVAAFDHEGKPIFAPANPAAIKPNDSLIQLVAIPTGRYLEPPPKPAPVNIDVRKLAPYEPSPEPIYGLDPATNALIILNQAELDSFNSVPRMPAPPVIPDAPEPIFGLPIDPATGTLTVLNQSDIDAHARLLAAIEKAKTKLLTEEEASRKILGELASVKTVPVNVQPDHKLQPSETPYADARAVHAAMRIPGVKSANTSPDAHAHPVVTAILDSDGNPASSADDRNDHGSEAVDDAVTLALINAHRASQPKAPPSQPAQASTPAPVVNAPISFAFVPVAAGPSIPRNEAPAPVATHDEEGRIIPKPVTRGGPREVKPKPRNPWEARMTVVSPGEGKALYT